MYNETRGLVIHLLCSFKMKRVLPILSLILLVIAAAIIWQPAKRFLLEDSCLNSGGKWASNGNYCIHRDCAVNNSCKPSYRNYAICESLKTGISRNELYFQLGMPESNKGNTYFFTGGSDAPKIRATIEDDIVVSLQCRT
jgi:hypothetical protein